MKYMGEGAGRLVRGSCTLMLVGFVIAVSNIVVGNAGGDSPLDLSGVALSALVFTGPFWLIYNPHSSRLLERSKVSVLSVLIATSILGFAGYLGVSLVPSPTTLLVVAVLLTASLPGLYELLQRINTGRAAVVAGDDPEKIQAGIEALDGLTVGYLSPSSTQLVNSTDTTLKRSESVPSTGEMRADGTGVFFEVKRIAGLSRLEHVLLERRVNTVALGFQESDREEFFGALRVCHKHGVDVMVHQSHVESVLVSGDADGEFIEVDLEPWPWYSRLVKRGFDVCFSVAGLLALSPLLLIITVAIKLDSPGPVLYKQTRTAELGATFDVTKFRTMLPDDEIPEPDSSEATRITRVGSLLRRSHLDEIPQLLSILNGDMSVVGPRAVWIDEERYLADQIEAWSKRWGVKPGLTGLAQIKGADSAQAQEKFQYDLAYISRHTFWFDLIIVFRQVWLVIEDVTRLIRSESSEKSDARE